MKLARMLVVCAAVLPAAWGQKWEVGGGVGGGFYTSDNITSPDGSASAKIQSNLAGSVWLGNYTSGKWGGELRYDYQMGDVQLSQGSTQVAFGARTQDLHYDFLWHFTGGESRVQPFVAFGAGIKFYQGTGTQVVYQPLSNIALLTQAEDMVPMVSGGGGLKFRLTPHFILRLDVHDYLTPFPKQVIAPALGAKVGGWLQDFVPMAGVSFVF
jgi:hypothetical protein